MTRHYCDNTADFFESWFAELGLCHHFRIAAEMTMVPESYRAAIHYKKMIKKMGVKRAFRLASESLLYSGPRPTVNTTINMHNSSRPYSVTEAKDNREWLSSMFTFMLAAKPLSATSAEGGVQTKIWRNNPMQSKLQTSPLSLHHSPRCEARTRQGSPCQSPAMKNGRCRMHGGLSTGAPKGNKNALKHGYYTAEAIAGRQALRELLRQMLIGLV